jgi:hypothetical protein
MGSDPNLRSFVSSFKKSAFVAREKDAERSAPQIMIALIAIVRIVSTTGINR